MSQPQRGSTSRPDFMSMTLRLSFGALISLLAGAAFYFLPSLLTNQKIDEHMGAGAEALDLDPFVYSTLSYQRDFRFSQYKGDEDLPCQLFNEFFIAFGVNRREDK